MLYLKTAKYLICHTLFSDSSARTDLPNTVQWQLCKSWSAKHCLVTDLQELICPQKKASTNTLYTTADYQYKIQILNKFHLLNSKHSEMLLTLTPVTSMSLRQFSAVSCVQRCPSTHQSHGNEDDTHCVHELYVLQSKNVKFVVTKSGPDVIRTDSLAVKWSATTKQLLLKVTDFVTVNL
jgi:hypothetical protein